MNQSLGAGQISDRVEIFRRRGFTTVLQIEAIRRSMGVFTVAIRYRESH
jgi:hypothetical protein